MNQTPNSPSEFPDNSQPPSLSKHKVREKNKLVKRFQFSWVIIGTLVGISSGAIVLNWFWQKLEASVPENIEDVQNYARPETLTIKAKDNSILKQIGPIAHDKVKLAEVSDILPSAFIASEDRRFWKHQGIDFQGIARATVANLKAKGVVEGGSTITQQVARVATSGKVKF